MNKFLNKLYLTHGSTFNKLYNTASVIVFIAVAFIDRMSKLTALSQCQREVVLTPFLSSELHLNRGIVFGIGHAQSTWLFYSTSLVALLMTIACIWHAYELYQRNMPSWGISFVIGGSLSNLCDRWYYGGVIDFIVLHYHDWVWPIFNIADVMICIGIGMMLLQQLRNDYGT